jgi:hypothetical protein
MMPGVVIHQRNKKSGKNYQAQQREKEKIYAIGKKRLLQEKYLDKTKAFATTLSLYHG